MKGFRIGQPRRSKFGAKKHHRDGHTFDSGAELARYCELKIEERAGMVRDVKVHVKFPLKAWSPALPQGVAIATYTCDFDYERLLGAKREYAWVRMVEDVKSEATADKETWPRTKAMFDANYGFQITEVFMKRRGGRR